MGYGYATCMGQTTYHVGWDHISDYTRHDHDIWYTDFHVHMVILQGVAPVAD